MRIFNKQRNLGERITFRGRCDGGFTLAEVVISVALAGIIFSGILTGYVQAAKRAEWAGYNLAAGATAIQQIEQARAAVWDSDTGNNIYKIQMLGRATNGATVTGYNTNILDIPYSGGPSNYLWVTNYVTIVSNAVVGNPNVKMLYMRVDAVWRFRAWGGNRFFTNTMATMLAPDDRSLGN